MFDGLVSLRENVRRRFGCVVGHRRSSTNQVVAFGDIPVLVAMVTHRHTHVGVGDNRATRHAERIEESKERNETINTVGRERRPERPVEKTVCFSFIFANVSF